MPQFANHVLIGMLPELVLVGVAGIICAYARWRRDANPDLYRWLACLGAVGAMAATFVEAYQTRFNSSGEFLDSSGWLPGSLMVDRLSLFAAITVAAAAAISALLSGPVIARHPTRSSAYHALLLVAAASGLMLDSSRDMATLLGAFALLIVCVVAVVGIAKVNPREVAAAHRTLIITGVAIALVSYGLALSYGITGRGDLGALSSGFARSPILAIVAVTFILLGLGALLGALPLSHWIVDISTDLPGAAAGAVMAMTFPAVAICLLRIGADAWGQGIWWWRSIWGGVAVISALWCGIAASRQTSVRRLLSWTVCGQMMVAMAALCGGGPSIIGTGSGAAAAGLLDIVVVTLVGLGAMAASGCAAVAGVPDSVADHHGVVHRLRQPLGGLWTLALLALGGLPPLGLFIAHLLVWESVLSAGYAWVVALMVVASLLLALAPLRLVATSLAEEPQAVTLGAPMPRRESWGLTFCCLASLLALLLAEPLLHLTTSAVSVLGP